MKKKHRNILDILKEIRDIKKHKNIVNKIIDANKVDETDKIGIFEILSVLHAKGFAILIFLFCLPLTVPIPVPPGYTTLFSIPVILFSIQMLLGRKYPWLPKIISSLKIKRSILAYIVEKTSPFLIKLEKLSRSRIPFFFSKIGEKFYAIISFVCSIAIALPLPMTNLVPALGLVLYSIAMINRDGLLAIIAIIICLSGLIITTLVIVLGSKFIQFMLNIFH